MGVLAQLFVALWYSGICVFGNLMFAYLRCVCFVVEIDGLLLLVVKFWGGFVSVRCGI